MLPRPACKLYHNRYWYIDWQYLAQVECRSGDSSQDLPPPIRSKIYYACIVFGSSIETALKHLDVVVNDVMRISTGAFKSTPIKNLNILCNEPELKLRRYDLMLRYYFKLKCHLQNPAYSSLIDDRLELYFNSRQYTMKPVIMRLRRIIDKYRIITQPVQPYITPKEFFWVLNRPDRILQRYGKQMWHLQLWDMHWENMKKYHGWKIIYTDGSKSEQGVGAAAVMGEILRRYHQRIYTCYRSAIEG